MESKCVILVKRRAVAWHNAGGQIRLCKMRFYALVKNISGTPGLWHLPCPFNVHILDFLQTTAFPPIASSSSTHFDSA